MSKIIPSGLGIWVWQRNDWNNIIKNCQEAGIKWVAVKMADTHRYPYFSSAKLKELLNLFHSNGLLLLAWNYSVVDTWPQQVQMIKSLFDDGLDGIIIDAESEWEFHKDGPTDQIAINFMQALRQAVPDGFIAHAPFACPDFHSAFPYTSFNTYCDAVLDQAYWTEFGWTVDYTMQLTDQQWAKYYSKRPQITTPRCPIAPTYGSNNYGPQVKGPIHGADVIKFLDHYKDAPMVSLYSYDACAPEVWKYLKDRHAGVITPAPPPPISNPEPISPSPLPPDGNSELPSLPSENIPEPVPQPMQPVQNGLLSFIVNNFMQIINGIGQLFKWFKLK